MRIRTGQFNDGLAPMLDYNPVWYWVMSFIALTIIMLTIFVLLRLQTRDPASALETEPVKQSLAAEVDRAFLLWSNGTITMDDACQRASILLREHLQQKTGIPAGTMTLSEIEQVQVPMPVLMNHLEYLNPIIFGGKRIADNDEFMQFMNSTRAVLDGKWN